MIWYNIKTGLRYLAGLLTVTRTLLTASWQGWRAATKNPVDALRYE